MTMCKQSSLRQSSHALMMRREIIFYILLTECAQFDATYSSHVVQWPPKDIIILLRKTGGLLKGISVKRHEVKRHDIKRHIVKRHEVKRHKTKKA